jgi:hypothetical protein
VHFLLPGRLLREDATCLAEPIKSLVITDRISWAAELTEEGCYAKGKSPRWKTKRHHTGGPLLRLSSRRRPNFLHERMSLLSTRGSLASRRLAYWLNAERQSSFSMRKA